MVYHESGYGIRFGIPLALALLILSLPVKRCMGEDAKVTEIREKALATIRKVKTLEYESRLKSNTGWLTKISYHIHEGKFLVEREDTVGDLVMGKRVEPITMKSAFDDQRQQTYRKDGSRIRLKDGATGASYGIETAETLIYSWIQSPGNDLRWDTLRDPKVWSKNFEAATYKGKQKVADFDCDAIDFFQHEGYKTPCYFRVYFVDSLGYFPIRYDRFVEKNNVLASSMSVNKHKVFQVEGSPFTLPLEVTFEANNADGVSLPMKLEMTVDEKSIKLNQPIDDKIFTLPNNNVENIFDVDATAKHIRETEKHWTEPPATPIIEGNNYLFYALSSVIVLAFVSAGFLSWKRSR